MKNLCSIILFFSCYALSAQNQEKVIRIQDFNEDQIDDTLRYELFHGYTHFMTFTDGTSHTSYEFYREDSKASFLAFISIPEQFQDEKHKELLDSVRYRLCHLNRVDHFSPSLTWLMDAYRSNIANPKSTYFSQTIQAPLNWQNWPPEFPQISYSLVDSDSLAYPLIYDQDARSYVKKPDAGKGWLLYYGHNHRQVFDPDNPSENVLRKTDSTESYKLFTSNHGLVLKKDLQYSWIFHTDNELTGGPGKLRWPSMDTVFIHQDHVFIHHISPIVHLNRIFIINLENGMFGKLKLQEDFRDNNSRCFSMRIEQNSLIVVSGKTEDCGRSDDGPEEMIFPLEDVFSELAKLYINRR